MPWSPQKPPEPDLAGYAELQVTTNFSFLQGGSHAEELVATGKALGLRAIAITDRNTLSGVARAHLAARETGMRLIVGARLDLEDAPSLICLPTDRAAYGRLCSLLTIGQRRAEKGKCRLFLADVAAHAEGQILIVLPPANWRARNAKGIPASPPRPHSGATIIPFPKSQSFPKNQPETAALAAPETPLPVQFVDLGAQRPADAFATRLAELRRALPDPLYLAATFRYSGDDRGRIAALARLAETCGIPLVATGDVLYHTPERRPLQDVLTAIREKCRVDQAGFKLAANAERHLKPPREMLRLFDRHPDAIRRTLDIADACRFSLDELRYEYPDEPVPPGKTPQQHLEDLTFEGAAHRYPDGLPAAVDATLRRELEVIAVLQYAPYFLTVHDIVSYARSRGILCQGRGSAANSAVCFCLGITSVNPAEIDLLFDRFITPERKEPPDIDVDFEHERREEVIQYIYARYGRERAGLAATVISYRARSAVREAGKAMGLSQDTVAALSGMVWGTRSGGILPEKHVREAGLDPADPRLARVLALAGELTGFPRHLSQHVGGFVLTRGPLSEMVPIGNAAMVNRTNIEWDKDDLDALGLLKVDVLGLGMLSCIRKGFEFLERHYGRKLTLGTVPREDPAVYDMLCRADSIGVFQVESRAQMNMLPRLKPRTFYDLVIEVAIVRPGPIQGDMVHPYLRRRAGLEQEEYPAPDPAHGPKDELRRILGKTKGVPLFQEQAMRIAIEAAKFTADEVNELRRAMATFRRRGTIGKLEEKMITRMVARGYKQDFAERCFNQIKGFGEYGFPESHAASFALLVYVSAWLKCHYPAAFAAALLNSQPMGFYAPAQIVRDAREHGVEARGADVGHSDWDSTLEPALDGRFALRLGLRQVDGLREDETRKILDARGPAGQLAFRDIEELHRLTRVEVATLERLAAADAFRSFGRDRRQALWETRALAKSPPLPLFAWSGHPDRGEEPEVALPLMPLSEHVVNDYQTLRLSLKAHPMSFLRQRLAKTGARPAQDLRTLSNGALIQIAGLVLIRQRPGTAKGVVFMTLEDETGVANAVIWPKVLERDRKVVMGGRLVLIHGVIQRHEDIIHVVAGKLIDRSDWLLSLSVDSPMMPIALANADEVRRPEPGSARNHAPTPSLTAQRLAGHPRDARIIPKSRDFH